MPNFLLALLIMYFAFSVFGMSVGGLFSPDYVNAPWSFARLGDLLAHIWILALVVGLGGTASLIRIMRANLLDELNKPYVTTARAGGPRRDPPVAKISAAPRAEPLRFARSPGCCPASSLAKPSSRSSSASPPPVRYCSTP